MQSIRSRFISNTVFFFLVYGLMVYVVARAVRMDITHDEAYSFYNAKQFWWVETLCTGNTHWFNFLAIKSCILFGFEKASQLRWFTLLSSGVFLTLIYVWIKSIRDLPLKIFAFVFTALNPFLVDYLSLARGYSTGLAFEALSIVCYLISINGKSRPTATAALVFAGMSAIANFNFFYFFAAFCLVYFFRFYFMQGSRFLRERIFYLESFYALAISALVLKALDFITVCSNDIGAYGGDDLISGVFIGFVHTFIYRDVVNPSVLNTAATAWCFLMFVACVYGIRFRKKHRCQWYTVASFLLLIMIMLTLFTRMAFDVLYPTYRTALMFYPLFALVLVGFLNAVLSRPRLRKSVLFGISTTIFIHFCSTWSLTRSFDYWQQSYAKESFRFLDGAGAHTVGIAPELFGVYRNYYQMTDRYRFTLKGYSINTMEPQGIDDSGQKLNEFDYLVLFPPYNLSYYRNNVVRFKGELFDRATGTLVVKVK